MIIHLILVMTVLAITHLFCFAILSELKYSIKKTVTIYVVTAMIFVSMVGMAYIIFQSNLISAFAVSYWLTITICFFVFLFTSTDTIDKKIFLFISYANLFCILWGVSDILCVSFFPGSSVLAAMYVKNTIRTLMTIPVICLYIKYLRPVVRGIPSTKKKIWLSLSLSSALFLIAFSTLICGMYKILFPKSSYVAVFIAVTLIYASVLWVVFGNIQQMSRENKMRLIDQKAKYLQSELELARQNELISKRIKHDYRHHIHNIAAMLKNGEVKHALSYIDNYDTNINTKSKKEICPNITVNAILTYFYEMAQNKGISFTAYADTPLNSQIADTDFVAILSNLLENALNGCSKCKVPGEIRINIRTIENKTVIVCSNSCRDDIEIVDNMLKNKGIGIDSIIFSAKKYDGDISYKYDNGILTVCIILKT